MTTGASSFGRDSRLHVPAEFATVFNNRRVLRGEWFHLHYGPLVSHARFGLVIPKKHARHAVSRNLLKRIGREAFRHVRKTLPARDLVVRLVRPLSADHGGQKEVRRRWRAEIDALLQRLPNE